MALLAALVPLLFRERQSWLEVEPKIHTAVLQLQRSTCNTPMWSGPEGLEMDDFDFDAIETGVVVKSNNRP